MPAAKQCFIDTNVFLVASDTDRPNHALNNIQAFGTCIQLLNESPALTRKLQQLVGDYTLKGKRIHDANIVATMQANGLTRLKTYNQSDFITFEGIEFA